MKNHPQTPSMIDLARDAVTLAKRQGAKEASATATRSRDVSVEWRDGKLERVSEATTRNLVLQLYVDGRYSSVQTSDLRPDALASFVSSSIDLTRTLAADPHRKLPDPELYRGQSSTELSLEDPGHAGLTPDDRRRFAEALESAARAADPTANIISVTSAFRDSAKEVHHVTSNGFEGSQRMTHFQPHAEVSLKDPDGRRPEEYEYAFTRFRSDLPSPEQLGKNATRRALGRVGSTKAPSGVMTMVVEDRSAGRMMGMTLGAMVASAVQQKRSFLEGKIGEKVGSAKLDVVDDPLLARGIGSRHFDSEGLAARRLPLFTEGALSSFYVDTYYGRKLGAKPTTAGPSNLVWRLGDRDLTGLLADVGEGIFVTGFLGGNSNPATGDFSLGVQGFRLRGGRTAEPIGEMNISGNLGEFWQRLVAVGRDPFPYSQLRTPALVFEGVQFAGV
jgi:PmbA protein